MLCTPVADFLGAVSQLENAKLAKTANPKAMSADLCIFFIVVFVCCFVTNKWFGKILIHCPKGEVVRQWGITLPPECDEVS